MSRNRLRISRGIVIGGLAVALAFAPGCRKSKTAREEEERKQRNLLEESKVKEQETVASNRQQYDRAKELIAQRKYDEAWAQFQDVIARDPKIKFEFEMYASENLPEQLFRVADDLAKITRGQFEAGNRARVKERFQEANRTLVFVRDHIEKKRARAEEKIKYLEHLWGADQRLAKALWYLDVGHEYAEGVRLLEEVRDNYKDTPYYDLAIKKLIEVKPPQN
jgi:hypothetical protein